MSANDGYEAFSRPRFLILAVAATTPNIAERMQSPKRSYATVNVSRINRHTAAGEIIVVPGKVLGAGELGHPVVVGAFVFSDGARSKITDAGGECLTIEELMVRAPTGSNVRIIR
ncbi:MAG: 50S ribosomal protein L18e [Candidatus Methanogaster sp.]|nr:MAG: 50S ribosomal protein L18e [ANME-2 cluster archaeon]